MTNIDTTDARSRTLTAFFDSRGAADQAVTDLEAAGIPRQHIRRADGDVTSSTAPTAGAGETGFWASLKDMFMPEEDRYGYQEGLRRGGFVVAVTADEANYQRVIDILDRDGAVDMDEREASWRKEGWTGYEANTTGASLGAGSAVAAGAATAGAAAVSRTATFDERTVPPAQVRSVAGDTAATSIAATTAPLAADRSAGAVERAADRVAGAAARTVEAGAEEVVPIYEESLRVGKRDVSHGRVRLRSYVVETPVEERVDLRQERVEVERRPVDRPATGLTGDVFAERVIEVEERAEEAVVSKEVRLKEEIALRKQAEQRSETVSDTVRRTEVEVQDERGRGVAPAGVVPAAAGLAAGAATGAASTLAGRIREHMDVIALGGAKIGTVDHLDGTDRIKLAKTASPDGQHHFIPLTWVERVDQHVHLNKGADAVKAGW